MKSVLVSKSRADARAALAAMGEDEDAWIVLSMSQGKTVVRGLIPTAITFTPAALLDERLADFIEEMKPGLLVSKRPAARARSFA